MAFAGTEHSAGGCKGLAQGPHLAESLLLTHWKGEWNSCFAMELAGSRLSLSDELPLVS